MKRPSVSGGILFAVVAAVFAAPLWWGLAFALPYATALRLVAVAAALAYVVYLVRVRRSRIGMVTQLAVHLFLSLVLCVFPSTTTPVLFFLALLVTLNRSLLFHRSLVAAVLDGGLALAGLTFAGYLFESTRSVPASVWGFLLLQAPFVLIPPAAGAGLAGSGPESDADPFAQSQRQAEAALDRLIQS